MIINGPLLSVGVCKKDNGSSNRDLLMAQRQTVINPFPHTRILQQTTLNIFCQQIENLYN